MAGENPIAVARALYILTSISPPSLEHFFRVFTFTMILNPILMLLLAGLSFVVGAVILNETENWLSGIPFVVFIFLFCLSLFGPEMEKAQLVERCRVALKSLIQMIKSGAEWLGAFAHHGARYLAQKRFELSRARHAKPIIDG